MHRSAATVKLNIYLARLGAVATSVLSQPLRHGSPAP